MSILATTPNTAYRTDFWRIHASEFLQRQMQLNFFLESHEHEAVAPAKTTAKPFSIVEFEKELDQLPMYGKNTEKWMDEDLAAAHATVFRDSLSLLTISGNSKDKRDVLAWIFAPDTQVKLYNGTLQHVHASNIPFSFYLCAREYGVPDVDEFRAEMLGYLDESLVVLLKRYMQTLH